MEVKWKKGAAFKTPAEVAYEQIEKIREKNGGSIRAVDVVTAAKSQRNPLHKDFEWDDTKAAHEYRLYSARHMLRCFVVERKELKPNRPQRVYEITTDIENEPGKRRRHVYRTMEDIMKDPDTRAELLSSALRELMRVRNRYRDLQELAVVMRAIDAVLETADIA